MADIEDDSKNPPPLDEDDIALLKTYVRDGLTGSSTLCDKIVASWGNLPFSLPAQQFYISTIATLAAGSTSLNSFYPP